MTAKKKVLAIIPARGGSRSIPLKNIKRFAGKPLISYMIEEALKSKTLDRVIVSTDHDEITKIAKKYGAEVPFKRPADISEDVPTEYVLQHAVRFLKEKEDYYPDIVVTLQCTTPLCEAEDIDATVNKLVDTGAETAITVTEVSQHPYWMMKLDRDKAVPFMNVDLKGEVTVRQNLPKLYIPNGAVFATRIDVLMQQNRIIGEDTRTVIMSREKSIDIDDMLDFKLAELLMLERRKKYA